MDRRHFGHGVFITLFLCVFQTFSAGDAVLVEAESFASHGGWVVDQQFIEQMGSPYLMAHGLGRPVEDAVTTVAFPSTGQYYLWVRTKDWAPGPWEAPGRFEVWIDGSPVSTVFGAVPGWNWQYGGTVDITDVQTRIALRDLTGFNGRCDALYFDKNPDVMLPNTPSAQRAWRNRLRGLPDTPPDGGRFDVIIVGGGIAGCAAALAADEQGLRVALVQDRPVLGGNASSEIRVQTLGDYGKGRRILERIDTEQWPNGTPGAIDDQNKRNEAMAAAAHITFFMPWRAYDVQTKGNRITSVDIACVTTGQTLRLTSELFIDCTGDGWIGYWAGAKYRYGRESRDEFNEGWGPYLDDIRIIDGSRRASLTEEFGDDSDNYSHLWSPKTPDNKVMGGSVLSYSVVGDSESDFPEVPWAMDVVKDHAGLTSRWYWEYSRDDLHQVNDGERIRDHMLRVVFGSFYNAKQNPDNAFHRLEWVAFLLGRRESRRLVGDYVFSMRDAIAGTAFADAVAEATRSVELKFQNAQRGSPYDFLSTAMFMRVPRHYIPFRTLYSVNIDNLMMAGRNFSCSHVGLGGPRVMRTTGQMGIAVGYAAALCKKYDTTPRGVYQHHLAELREMIGY